MLNKVREYLSRNDLIHPGEHVLIGLSGGADSVALLRVLLDLSEELSLKITAAHFHHGIRGEEADGDEAFAKELCGKWNVPCYAERADIPALAKEQKMPLEQAAREARYAFLRRVKAECGASVIAVAHHLQDQAESVLMHLIRGSGLTGLCGMRPKSGDIIRPLLCVEKSELLAYLKERGISFRTDSTNLEANTTRNRLRLDVMPYLKEHLNPKADAAIASTAEILQQEEDLLMSLAKDALARARRGDGYLRKALLDEPLPLRMRALRLMLTEHGIHFDIERKHLEALSGLLSARTGATLMLPGIEAYTSYDCIFLGKQSVAASFCLPLTLPGDTVTPAGTFRAMEVVGCTCFSRDRNVGCLDADKLPRDLAVRSRRNGDKFHPVGAPGAKKLKDYFIDKKVQRSDRGVPLLCSGDTVLFLPGYGVAQQVRITEDTVRALWITYTPEKTTDMGGNK
ncbi:MAG: tRNA lysidine(34) synthetase TilS [Clostridia bacterium]|nr:tRNA lysidine(34) synthetase TilS [Clostridia bacterium]